MKRLATAVLALLLAPTAGGKTEAAAFPLLTRMAAQRWTGTSVLYVCPLKALLNNLLPRLQAYASWLGRRVELWHGDVSGSRRQAILPFPIKGGKLYLYNNNPLLRQGYRGLTGLKTGYTDAAGRCFVATARRGAVTLGVVLLHSPDPATQATKLLDRGFAAVSRG